VNSQFEKYMTVSLIKRHDDAPTSNRGSFRVDVVASNEPEAVALAIEEFHKQRDGYYNVWFRAAPQVQEHRTVDDDTSTFTCHFRGVYW
jgi:hypothetical protein